MEMLTSPHTAGHQHGWHVSPNGVAYCIFQGSLDVFSINKDVLFHEPANKILDQVSGMLASNSYPVSVRCLHAASGTAQDIHLAHAAAHRSNSFLNIAFLLIGKIRAMSVWGSPSSAVATEKEVLVHTWSRCHGR